MSGHTDDHVVAAEQSALGPALADTATLIGDIVKAHEAAHAAAQSAFAHAVQCGRLLIELRDRLQHGAFGPALAQLPFSASSARGYMRLANLPDANQRRVADLPLRLALRFAAFSNSDAADLAISLYGIANDAAILRRQARAVCSNPDTELYDELEQKLSEAQSIFGAVLSVCESIQEVAEVQRGADRAFNELVALRLESERATVILIRARAAQLQKNQRRKVTSARFDPQ